MILIRIIFYCTNLTEYDRIYMNTYEDFTFTSHNVLLFYCLLVCIHINLVKLIQIVTNWKALQKKGSRKTSHIERNEVRPIENITDGVKFNIGRFMRYRTKGVKNVSII